MKKHRFLKHRKFVAIALAAALTVTSANGYIGTKEVKAADIDLDSGLVVHYSFDDSLENSAEGGGNATMFGQTKAAYAEDGVSGKAFDFSANAGTNTKDGAKALIQMDKVSDKTSFSLNYWVKGDAADNEVFFEGICKYFQFGLSADKKPFARGCQGANNAWDNADADPLRFDRTATGDTAVDDTTKWRMVTYTVSETGQCTVYVNGTKIGLTKTWEDAGLNTSVSNPSDEGFFAYKKDDSYLNSFSDGNVVGEAAFIGGGCFFNATNFSGLMDEFRMYGRALTADEVKELAKEGFGEHHLAADTVDGITGKDGVYSVPSTLLTSGKANISDLFKNLKTVDINGGEKTALTFATEGVKTYVGDTEATEVDFSDEEEKTVKIEYKTFSLTFKMKGVTQVDCSKLEASKTSLELPKKGADVTITATGTGSNPTTEEIKAGTPTGCTVTKKGDETITGNQTAVVYTIVPTADSGSVTFTCGGKSVTVNVTRKIASYNAAGALNLDFEAADTSGDGKYIEDSNKYTLAEGAEVVKNPDDASDKVLKTTGSGYLQSAAEVLKDKDFSEGVTVQVKIRPDTQASDWDYLFSIGKLTPAYYVDGTIGFIARSGDPYNAFFPDNGWVAGNPAGSDFAFFKNAANCGKWYTLTYTYADDEFCIYMDGVPTNKWTMDATKKTAVADILSKLPANSMISLGCGINSALEKTPACYDDFTVIDRAVSAEEAAYRAALGKAEDLTSAQYKDNAAKQAIQAAIIAAKSAVQEGAQVSNTVFSTQAAALKSAVTTNEAGLEVKTFTITSTAASHFAYDKALPATVKYGEDLTFKVIADNGYDVTVKIGGKAAEKDSSGSYSVTDITADQTIEVTATAREYPLIKYVDGVKTEDTFTIADAASGKVSLPAISDGLGWFTDPDERDSSNAITEFTAANYMKESGITVYSYNNHTITWPDLADAGADTSGKKTKAIMGETISLPTKTDEDGKTPSATVKDAAGNVIDTWVTVSGENQVLNFTMPASNVTVSDFQFVGVSAAALTKLVADEKALYDSANATTTEGLDKKYTDASWTAFNTAYEAARDFDATDKTQAEIDEKKKALQDAVDGLVYKYVLNATDVDGLEPEKETAITNVTVITDSDKKALTDLTWSSSDEGIAAVTRDAKLKAVSAGEATITVTAPDGTTAKFKATVKAPLSAMTMRDFSIVAGAKRQLVVTSTPADADLSGVTWTSGDPSVITVDNNGVVHALKKGFTEITAKAGGVTASCEVTVIDSLASGGYFAVKTPGIEVTEDGVYMTFNAKTDAAATDAWNAPIVSCYSGSPDSPQAGSAVLRSDLWVLGTNSPAENLSEETPDWTAFVAACKEGVPCHLSAEKVSGGVKVRLFVGEGATQSSGQCIIPVAGGEPYYLTLSNDACAISDIKVVPKAEYREPAPYVPSIPWYPDLVVTPKPAETPGPVIDTPIKVDDVVADETLIGTEWWNGMSRGNDYSFVGTNTAMELYIGAVSLDGGGYGAFSVELVSDGNKYLTTGSDKNAWFAEDAKGDELDVPNTGSELIAGHVYRITITRNGQDVTVKYYDATAQEDYFEVVAKNVNFSDNINVHVMAQVGTFKIGQKVNVSTDPGAPTVPPATTTVPTQAPSVTEEPAPTAAPTAAPTNEPQQSATPTKEPGSKVSPGDKVTTGGTVYTVQKNKQVTYTAKKKVTATVSIPATVKIKGKTYKVTSVSANAFKNNKKIKKVTISKNITKIGKGAFKSCKNLKTIIIKTKKLKASAIGAAAFSGISKKAVIRVPKSKLKAYKKLLRKKGLPKKAKVKAI